RVRAEVPEGAAGGLPVGAAVPAPGGEQLVELAGIARARPRLHHEDVVVAAALAGRARRYGVRAGVALVSVSGEGDGDGRLRVGDDRVRDADLLGAEVWMEG